MLSRHRILRAKQVKYHSTGFRFVTEKGRNATCLVKGGTQG